MSKYRNVKIKGNGNRVGDTTTVTNNYYNQPNRGSDGNEIIGIGLGLVVLLAAVVWFFFNHIDQVYFYLRVGAVTSPILAILAIVIFWKSGYLEEIDLIGTTSSIAMCAVLVLLSEMTRQNISDEIIQLALRTDVLSFWDRLSDYGKKNVAAHFLSAILLTFAIFVTHLFSLRQLSESAGNPDGLGFWYGLYEGLSFFRMRNTYISFFILAILIFVAAYWNKIF